MKIQPSEIVGIPFPYTDMSTQKRRPVLVLTAPDQRGDFIGLAVTSVLTEENTFRIESDSLEKGRLPKTSWVRYDKTFTLNASLIKTHYGSLQKNVFERIISHLCDHVGCQ